MSFDSDILVFALINPLINKNKVHNSPGIIPAKNKAPTDWFEIVARTTIIMLGGIIVPNEPLQAIIAAAKSIL